MSVILARKGLANNPDPPIAIVTERGSSAVDGCCARELSS
jgi:hypothetical protein